VGEDAFEYTITDDKKGKASAWVRVQVHAAQANQDPVAVDEAATTDEDTPVTIAVLSNDSDPDEDPLSVASVTQGANGSAAINPNGTVTYTPNENFNGSDSFTYTVSDNKGGSASATVTVTVNAVNDAPVITSPAKATATEDEIFTYTATASDVDNPSVDIAISALSDWLAADGSTVSGTPTEGTTAGSFTITADDGELTAVLDVTVTVGEVNDAPVAVDDEATTDEDILANDSDPDEDALTITGVTPPANGITAISGSDIIYTPNENFNGSDSFTYTVSDNKGGSASASVAIAIAPVNDAPVAVDDIAGTPEDVAVIIEVLVNDYDVDDGDLLTVQNVRQAQGKGNILIDRVNGTLLYTPSPNFSGEDVFYYTIRDAAGAEDEGMVTMTVGGVNDAPVADAQSVTTEEDTPKAITLTGSDPDDDAITYAYTQPDHGTLSGDAPDLTYSPDKDFNGVDEFTFSTFSVTDPYGATGSATVSITVSPVNDAPVITSAASATATEDVLFSYTATASDVDDATVTIIFSNLPGWLTTDGSTVSGTPTEGVTSGSFTITASDGELTAVLDVTITVGQVNDPPIADAQSVATEEDTPLEIILTGSDPDGDELTFTVTSGPANGSLTGTAPNLTYTPASHYSGSDGFTFRATDPGGLYDEATVMVLVNLAGDLAADVPVEPDAGGTVTTDIGVSVEIPGGSLDEAVNIQIGTYDEVPPGAPDLAGILYFFGPSGTTFDPPATITVPYDPDLLPEGFDPADLVLLIYSEIDGTWAEALNSVVDTDAQTVSGQTYHFSGFAAGLLLARAPQLILSLPEPVIEEDAQSTVIIENLNDYFADPNFGDQVDFDATSLDVGLHRVFVTDEAELIVDPQQNFYGEVRIVITATDDGGLSTSDTLFLTVTADNDPPFFPPGFRDLLAGFMTINEDQMLRIPLMADDVEGDDVTFHAASDTSGVTTLVQDTTLLVVPIQDWFGTAHITVSASDGLDTTNLDPLTLTIESVNDPPSAFELLAPDIDASIQVETSQLGDFLTFTWEEVIDPDDSVNYTFTLSDTGAIYFEYDTTTTATEVRVPYADIVSAMTDQGLKTAAFEWTVVAIAGQDIIEASSGPNSLTVDITTLAVVDESHLPQFFALYQNYPNPFNPVTTLRYELPAYCQVLLVIYDMRGREVVRLVDGYVSAGYSKVIWNSSDAFGRPVPSGIYFARLITPEYTHVIKMSLIR